MTTCPACGSTDIHRSRSASLAERGLKLFSKERPHRCHACGWRGWGIASPHRHAPTTTADGWEAIDMSLVDLDAAAEERKARRESAAAGSAASAWPSGGRRRSHKHRSSQSASRAGASEFNRRVQLILFVALLLLGVVVVLRTCSGGSRTTEPEAGRGGQVAVQWPFPS
jgi:predicted RNA-binding Zn-ribbon protein involved in translation (DUF1610 family)